MIQPIILYGDPLLRVKSKDIERYSRFNLKQFIDDMFETMHKANGIGLSAIQIGVPLNIFVIEINYDDIEEDDSHFKKVFINPNIKEFSGEKIKLSEGCLSIPQISAQVERYDKIKIEWFDENWDKHEEEFSGLNSRAIQHEYDHLQGKLFIDKLDTMWEKVLEEPIDLIKNRKIQVPYLIK